MLEPVCSIERAIAPDAPILHDTLVTAGRGAPEPKGPTNIAGRMELRRGDLDKGFAEAEVVVEREFHTPTTHQGYIEPHACVARWGQDGQVLVWCSTQGPFVVRDGCAGILGIDAATIKVIPSEIGGGFGGKIPVYLEPVAIVLSRKTGRPVKMVMTRDEVFRASGPTSATTIRMKLGAMRDGTLVAGSASLWYEAGAYRGSPSGAGAMCAFAPYRIPNFFIEAFDVVVNKPKVAAYRAPGSPMAAFATESLVDELARMLGIDPIELRLKNAVAEGDHAPYGPPYGPIGLKQTLEAARAHPHWTAPLAPNQGRGIGCGFWFNAGPQFERDDLAERRRERRGHDREPGHRRHACGAGDDGRRRARHPHRSRAAHRRRYRHGRLHRRHRRQPRVLRHRHGGDSSGARRPRAAVPACGEDVERRRRGRPLGRRPRRSRWTKRGRNGA